MKVFSLSLFSILSSFTKKEMNFGFDVSISSDFGVIRPVTIPASHLFFGGRSVLFPASIPFSPVMDGRFLTLRLTLLRVDGGLLSGSSRLCSIYGLCVSSVRLTLSFILLKDEGCEIDWCRLCSSRNRRSGGRLGFSLRRRRNSFSPPLCYRWTKVAISWRVYMHRQANVRVVDDASLSSSTVWLYGPDGPLMVLSLPFVWTVCLYYVGLCSFGHWPINKFSEKKKKKVWAWWHFCFPWVANSEIQKKKEIIYLCAWLHVCLCYKIIESRNIFIYQVDLCDVHRPPRHPVGKGFLRQVAPQ